MKPSSFDLPQPQRIVDQHPHSHTDNIRLAPFVIDQNVPHGYAETIETTCRRPEIHVLAAGMRFSFDADIDTPFRVKADGNAVILGPQALADPAIAALSIRHALELALWQRLASSHQHTGTHMAVAVIALRVAASYYQSLQPRERDTCLVQLPGGCGRPSSRSHKMGSHSKASPSVRP